MAFSPVSSRSHNLTRKLPADSIHTSVARLRQLQELLKEKDADCLLCIQGIDSRYNEGMQECISYLLFGLFDARKAFTSLEVDEEVIDDLIICVKVDSVDVYCNPVNYPYLLAYISCWTNLHVYCLSKSQYDTFDDVAEEFKIRSFVSMVSGCKRVSVAYFSGQHVGLTEFNAMSIEQWPIIQAYALEGYGCGTFFTLQHEVCDISSAVNDARHKVDVISFQQMLLQRQLPVFGRQWEVLDKTVQVARLNSFAEGFTETNAAEPLVTYYTHGRVGADPVQDSTGVCWTSPFVYMGSETKCMNMKDKKMSSVEDINTAGPNSTKALHMVCHGVAPRSGLMCTRTYFFDTSSLPPVIGDGHEYKNADVEQLSRAYKTAIEVTLQSIDDYVRLLKFSQVVENAKNSVIDGLQKFMDCRKLVIDVKLEYRLDNGSYLSVQDEDIPKNILTMFVIINNIFSATDKNLCLGGVAYSDSFLISTIRHASADTGVELNSEVVVLTQNVPRWSCWNISESCSQMCASIKSAVKGDDLGGDLLIDGQLVEVVSTHQWLQPIPCTIYLYSGAVILLNDNVGPITLIKDEIKSVSFYDGGGPSLPAFVIFYTSMDFQTKLPIQLQNTQRMLVVSLSPRSRAYKLFFEQVFEVWKSADETGFVFTMDDKLPPTLQPMHEKITAEFKQHLSQPLSTLVAPGPFQHPRLVGLNRFMDHLSASSCLSSDQVLSHSDFCTVVNQSNDPPMVEKSVMLTISIISGLPGSYKENVANFITKLTQERCRWVIHKQTPETSHTFDSAKLENSLSYVYNALRRKSNAGAKSSRMLVITPGYTDIQSVDRVIQNHPNEELREHVTIGAVTTCIDPLNCFISGHYAIPGLLNQCALGWVNNIVLTASSDHVNETMVDIQNFVRAANPSVNFILTEKGALTRSQDIELILSTTAFEQEELKRSRLLCQRQSQPSGESYGLDTVILTFKKPLLKQQLISKFQDMRIPDVGVDISPGRILYVCGRCYFEGLDGAFDITCATVSSSHRILPAKAGDGTGNSFMSFTGFSLEEDKLQETLRGCTPPKPQRKEYLTVETLERATKKAIHSERHLEPLPAGWFYNGSQYIDMMGERSDKHPHFDQFLQEYMDNENESIREFNNHIDRLDYHDLFE